MLKNIGFSVLSLLLSVSSASAFDLNRGDLDLKEKLSGMEVPPPQAEPAPRPAAKPALKEWTIMVFINGKNNLEQYALKDMNEMEMIGSTDKINVVTETGRIAGYDSSEGDWKGVRRYYIKKDTDTYKLSSQIVGDLGKLDMGDYKNLAAFGKWAKAKYPAKKYMLVVWNHGSGWLKSVDLSPLNKGISYDDESGNHISTPQLGLALREMGKVDVYGSDACLMQMPEVDYELKDHADYIVGSEETEPGDGYTYDLFLGPVAANPEMGPAELAKTAVDAYSDHYQSVNGASTQSFIKTAALPGLKEKVDAWTAAVMAAGLQKEVNAARGSAMSYSIYDNKDLYNFVRLVSESAADAAVKEKSAALLDFIKNDLVLHNRTNNKPSSPGGGGWDGYDGYDQYDTPPFRGPKNSRASDYSESHGIAVYLPGSLLADSSVGEGYSDLAWAAASSWDEFIAWYLK